jgi:hypothetical protein
MGERARDLELDVHLTRHESAVPSVDVLSTDEEISLPGDDQRRLLRNGDSDEQDDGEPDRQNPLQAQPLHCST